MENLKEFLEGNKITFIRLDIDGVTVGTEKNGEKKIVNTNPETLFETIKDFQKTGKLNQFKPEPQKGKGLFSKEKETDIEKPE